ncbi:hypothetical protein EXIGLDRAFT_462984 [Exidia glandulosa HHB12029]|uniref:F-box domain-containing protein n=1 Tax=Exidia glandulosa HHB12029 TaxID=1314781 RepID=A0A165K485_EXIGL|nr:hypothetical protein EXIGLDRAFT_462984 [Exidia glandulosa HHB12029]
MANPTYSDYSDLPASPAPPEAPGPPTARSACLVKQLTDEILCAIFVYLTVGGGVRASAVSRAWRRASVSSPSRAQVWSRLRLPSTRPAGLAALLARAGAGPVQLLEIEVNAGNIAAVGKCLAAHMEHLAALHLNFIYYDKYEEDDAPAFVRALCKPAPMLVSFALVDAGSFLGEALHSAASRLFGRQAPHLRKVKLYCFVQNIARSPVFAAAEEVHYAHPNPASNQLCSTDIRDLFKVFPSVRTLGIQIDRYKKRVKPASLPLQPPKSLTTLVLCANGADAGVAANLLREVRHKEIETIHIDYVDYPFWRRPNQEFVWDENDSEC